MLLAVACAAILLGALLVALRLPRRGLVAFWLAVALLAPAITVTTMAVAGFFVRSLQPTVLAGLALAWPVLALIIPAAAGMGPLRVGARAQSGVPRVLAVLREPAVVVGVVLVGATLAWRLVLALRLPVVDYDGWSYHLVFADVWLQHDALVLVPQRPWTAGYPAITELMTTWLMAFTRSDTLAGLTGLLPIPFAMLATTALARAIGARPRWAVLAGLLFGMIPAAVAIAGTSYVDTASVAAVVATWALGLRVVRSERDGAAALMLGIAGGLALGSKGTNALLVAPILVAAGLVLLEPVRHRGTVRRTVGRIALLVLPVLVFGASWYLKDLLVYGNPLYPFSVGPFAGVTTLTDFAFTPKELDGKGTLAQLIASWTWDWRLDWYDYNQRPGGLGRAWPIVGLGSLVGVALLVRRRAWVPLGLVVLPAAITLAVMPMPWYARLTLFLPGVALPLAALALDRVAVRRRAVASIAGLAVVLVATVSLAAVNLRPNVDVTAAFPGTTRPPQWKAYVSFVLTGSEPRRMGISLRGDCAGFATVPIGETVVPAGFNLLHGVVTPSLDRLLGLEPVDDSSVDALIASVRAQGAEWIVTGSDGLLDRMVVSGGDRFIGYGEVCSGGKLWRLAPTGGS